MYNYFLSVYPDIEWKTKAVSNGKKLILPDIDIQTYKRLSFGIIDEFYDNLIDEGFEAQSLESSIYLAQHYGLPTNLIDFTTDPKIALYFACEKEEDIDCSVYMYDIYSHLKGLSRLYARDPVNYLKNDDGSYMNENEKFESNIAQNDRIKYIGKTFGEDKVKLLQNSDTFVLPSYYKSEAFPISIIEAMACKNAIVTTNYKYLPDVINEQNGVLVEPKCVDSLADGIESLIVDKERLKKIQAYNKKEAKDNYSLDRHIERLKNIVT